jgi:hypothetical protein
MMVGVPITPSPGRGRGNKPETRPGVEPSGRGVVELVGALRVENCGTET